MATGSGTKMDESNAREKGCIGICQSLAFGAISTIFPKYITAIRSATQRTTDKSCEMKIIDRPSSFWRSFSRLMTCACIDTSSAEVGSSQMTISGSRARARAIPILCRCPPENSWGKRSSVPTPKPTRSASRATRSALSAREPPFMETKRLGQDLVDGLSRVRERQRDLGRSSVRWAGRGEVVSVRGGLMSRPFKMIEPSVGSRIRMIALPKVDFPHPDSPTRPRVSPGSRSKEYAVDGANLSLRRQEMDLEVDYRKYRSHDL